MLRNAVYLSQGAGGTCGVRPAPFSAESGSRVRDRGADVAEPDGGARCGGRLRVERAVADSARNFRMRVAERDALGDERLSGVGREQGRVGGGALQPLL